MKEYGPTIKFDDGRIVALDRVFPNQAALDKHWGLMEQVAGRELDWRTLKAPYGIHQPKYDTLSIREKIRDTQYIVKQVETVEESGNPYESRHIQELAAR